jgi:hypothetical protein
VLTKPSRPARIGLLIELDLVLRFCVLDGEKVEVRGCTPWKADMGRPTVTVVARVVLTAGIPAAGGRNQFLVLEFALAFE